ncbi:MAG: M3 family oligoendopeptidase [Spirochaetales bacterium]|nr:M3 family oligoendopeptidase [Spirochaetales bacterium]
MSTSKKTGAESILWDLKDLYGGPDDPAISADLEDTLRRAEALGKRYRGQLAVMPAGELHELVTEYEQILERSARAATFAYLSWSTDTEDPARGALLQRLHEHSARLQQGLLFLELAWANLPDDRAQALLDDPALAAYRFWLLLARRYRPHLLSEPEERILAEKAVTGRSAWVRFFEEVHGGMRYDLDGEKLPQQSVLARLYEPERERRRQAAEAFTVGLRSLTRINTYIFNNLLLDKASEDTLRSYPSWISARNLDNQIDDATVQALVEAVTGRYDVVGRYYRLKGRLLGVKELFDYDRYAPLPAAEHRYGWDQAREVVLEAYGEFHPQMSAIARRFFEERWVDAAVRPGKRGGAYSHGAVPSVHPYVLMNYTGNARDVMTLAHELGHGVHQYLSRRQGMLLAETPLTTAETASVFGEMLVFQRLMAREKDPRARLSLLVSKIEDTFATVFRQVAMNRFEEAVHTDRRKEGELRAERFGELWMESQEAMFAGSVVLTENYRLWWSYIPHFVHSPGYVYAYAFGELLVLALYARYQEAPEGFPDRYLRLLGAGGSNWPEELVKTVGVDLKDPEFWTRGLGMIDELVGQAEELAGKGLTGGAQSTGGRSR